jgi:hypothetical protein
MKHSKGHYNIKLCAKVQRENEKATEQWQKNIYLENKLAKHFVL